MIKTTTFLTLALPYSPPHPSPELEWGQLSRGGVEWVGGISQHRKWGGGCALCSSGDGVLAFQISPVPAGEEVTGENAFGSSPPLHPLVAAVLRTRLASEVPPPPPPVRGRSGGGARMRGGDQSLNKCAPKGALGGRQERGR